MNIEAKPPVRRGPGPGFILLAIVGAAACVPLLIIGAMIVFGLARSSRTEHVVYATPAYHDVSGNTQISREFEARLNAANRIQSMSERNAALAVLAADFSSTPDEANLAIQGIQDVAARDAAAWDAARRFSEYDRPQDSMKMIEAMLDQTTRDAGFRAVATGDWPDPPVAATTETVEVTDATEVREAIEVTEAVEHAEAVTDEVVVTAEAEEVTEAAEEVVTEEAEVGELVTEEPPN